MVIDISIGQKPIVKMSYLSFRISKNINYCNLLQVAKKQINKNLLVKTHKEMPEYWVGQRKIQAGLIIQQCLKKPDHTQIIKLHLDYLQ